MNRAFVFSTTAFLLIIPAAILAASFLHMVKSGDDATVLTARSDVTFYAYKNIKASFNAASCSYFLLSESDTSAIIGNLTDEWAPYIEANYTGINISIAKSQINVTYNAAENSIKVGNINDINDGIPINITYQNTTIEGEIGPLEIKSNCDVLTSGGAVEEETPQITLFLISGNNLSFTEGTEQQNETICGGDSASWTIDPLNVTGDFNITGNIDAYLQIAPTNEPSVTVKLSHDSTVLGQQSENQLANSTMYVFSMSTSAGTIIPAEHLLVLEVSVSGGGGKCIDLIYGSSEYNSAVVMPGSFYAPGTNDTTAPWFNGLQKLEDYADSVNLSWNAATDTSTPIQYNIYNGTSSGFTPSTAITSTYSLSYIDSGVGSTTYYYIVRAEDSAGNEDTNLMRLGRVGTGNITEILYSDGNASGSTDSIDTELDNAESTSFVTVDPGDIDIIKFDDPVGSVSEISSCIVYWRDRRTIGNPVRSVSVGNGSSWDWGTFSGQATGSFASYDLDITSHFTPISSPQDATDIQNIQVKYENQGTGNKDLEWDQVYVKIVYTE